MPELYSVVLAIAEIAAQLIDSRSATQITTKMDAIVPVDVLAARLRAVEDPLLQGKVAKALGVLCRAFALYRWACGVAADARAIWGAFARGRLRLPGRFSQCPIGLASLSTDRNRHNPRFG